MRLTLGFGTGGAVGLAAAKLSGGLVPRKDPVEDAALEKEAMLKNRRRPLEETVAAIGEGRGIYPVG
jgi:hypothetical protein